MQNQANGIKWTDWTSNPVRYRDEIGKDVWACVKVSAGCAHCYAEAMGNRMNKGEPFTAANMRDLEVRLDEKELGSLLFSKKIAGQRVFVGDMTDVFGEWVPDEILDRLFAAMAMRHDVTFQVLTKRPERMRQYLGMVAEEKDMQRWANVAAEITGSRWAPAIIGGLEWPLKNVWLGTTVENQAVAPDRIRELIRTPAAVRFLSCEPLLGPLDLGTFSRTPGAADDDVTEEDDADGAILGGFNGVDWVIVGGESGDGARECRVEWVRLLVQQCQWAGVPVFVKQLGTVATAEYYDRSAWDPVRGRGAEFEPTPIGWDRRQGQPPPGTRVKLPLIRSAARKDPEEWPEDLRIQEFPK